MEFKEIPVPIPGVQSLLIRKPIIHLLNEFCAAGSIERCPPAEIIERDARAQFGKVIPPGMTVTIYRWREKVGGADFHARYLLTNRGGMRIDAGFSAEGGHQTTDISLIDVAVAQEKRKAFERDAGVYELVEPVLKITPTGYVEHV